MTILLINGILCLAVAVFLIIQIYKTKDRPINEYLQKFIWLYWSILMITAIHHIFSAVFNDSWVNNLVNGLSPITDIGTAVAGLLLSAYLNVKQKEIA